MRRALLRGASEVVMDHSVPDPRHARADLPTCLAAPNRQRWSGPATPIGKASMLTLTENATAIVNEITTQPGLSEEAGLRITSAPTPEPSFEVTAAAQGEPGDQVVEQGGATVYLDPASAELLDDKVLDAAVDPAGKVEFALALQG